MKKILLSLLIAIPATIFAQNVGIGTPTPTGRLDVVGTGTTAATNVFMARNSNSDTLLKVLGDGAVWVGNPLVPDVNNYKFRVETGTSRGSLFIENPIINGGITLKILRGVSEASSGANTTALDVEASGDVAALFKGIGGIDATASNAIYPAGNFTATALDGVAINSNGKVRFGRIGESAGRVLTSDADGYATWQDATVPAHNHFGESWAGNSSTGLEVKNANSTTSANGITGWMNGGGSQSNIGVQGISNSSNGIGVSGTNSSTGLNSVLAPNSGVSGTAGSGPGVFGSSLTGPSIYGYKTFLNATGNAGKFENEVAANTDAVVLITNNAANPMALELNNGFIKVSGTNKTAFKVTATSGNVTSNRILLNYTGMAATDIIIAVHNFTGSYIGATGVWWDGTEWTIFREDVAAMPLNETFNVMVIKQ